MGRVGNCKLLLKIFSFFGVCMNYDVDFDRLLTYVGSYVQTQFLYILTTKSVLGVVTRTDQGCPCLRQVAWQLGLAEPLLDLVINKLDEGVVLLRELLLQDLIVLLADLVRAILKNQERSWSCSSSCCFLFGLPCTSSRKSSSFASV